MKILNFFKKQTKEEVVEKTNFVPNPLANKALLLLTKVEMDLKFVNLKYDSESSDPLFTKERYYEFEKFFGQITVLNKHTIMRNLYYATEEKLQHIITLCNEILDNPIK